MGHGHTHSHGHASDHGGGSDLGRLRAAFLITSSVLTAKTGEIIDSLEMASVKALNVISGKARRQAEA